jgi:hypothetical protein
VIANRSEVFFMGFDPVSRFAASLGQDVAINPAD